VLGVPFVIWLSIGDAGVDWGRFQMSLDEPHLPTGAEGLKGAFEECLAKVKR
jgi:hypothetical protein